MDKLTHDLLLLKDLGKYRTSSGHPPIYILYITEGLEEKNNERRTYLSQQCIWEAPTWHTDAHPVLHPETQDDGSNLPLKATSQSETRCRVHVGLPPRAQRRNLWPHASSPVQPPPNNFVPHRLLTVE